MDIEKLVRTELAELKGQLQFGDEVVSETSPSGKVIKHSKTVAYSRIRFMNLIKGLLGTGDLSTAEATKATQLFGKKTTKLFWIK